MDIARRDFIVPAAGGLTGIRFAPGLLTTVRPIPDPTTGPVFWVDSRQAALPARPWRKIHLDFHNSRHIERIGARFDADEFGETLLLYVSGPFTKRLICAPVFG